MTMESEGTIRASGDQMMELLDQLRTIEATKHEQPLGSAEFVHLARQADELSRLVFRWAGLQLQMAEATPSAVMRGELPSLPLTQIEARPLDRILAQWREAQMRFELSAPGSPEAAKAADEVSRLRREFQEAQSRKHDSGTDSRERVSSLTASSNGSPGV
jgi:hypothetical protein